MRWRIWVPVLVVTVVLASAGALTLRRPQAWPAASTRATALAARLAARLAPRAAVAMAAARGPAGRVSGAVALAVLSGWAFALGLAHARRDPLRGVLRELQRGTAAPRLARRTGLAQDALRTLLDPRVAGGRQRRRAEGSSAPARAPAGWFSGRGRRGAWGRCENGA
ncbi:MAG TPA: hypothetical protein VMS88_04150 [Terriglobales bacterium]|nr:hypothetical protein [Terriglobales bacterium]